MNLELDQRTRDLLAMTRELGRNHLRPLGIACDRAKEPLPPTHPFYELAVRSGWGREEVEEAPDGAPSYRFVRACVLAEEAAYWDRGMAVSLPGPGLGGPPVSGMGTPEQRERFLAPFRGTDRPRWAAFAMTEPGAGSDVARIQTRCRRDGDGWTLTGQKMFSSNSARAEWVVVFATVDPALGREGHRAFVVERGTPGFDIIRYEKKMGVRAYETCSFVLQDCHVPADNLLGGEAYYEGESRQGFKGAMAAFNATRPLVAIQAVGIARAAFDVARDVVREEYPRHGRRSERAWERLAEARHRIATARTLCLRAAWLLDRREPNALEASLAKLYTAPRCLEAVATAMEVIGEAGALQGTLVEKLYRDVKVIDIVEGTQQVQRVIAARRLVDLPRDD